MEIRGLKTPKIEEGVYDLRGEEGLAGKPKAGRQGNPRFRECAANCDGYELSDDFIVPFTDNVRTQMRIDVLRERCIEAMARITNRIRMGASEEYLEGVLTALEPFAGKEVGE